MLLSMTNHLEKEFLKQLFSKGHPLNANTKFSLCVSFYFTAEGRDQTLYPDITMSLTLQKKSPVRTRLGDLCAHPS